MSLDLLKKCTLTFDIMRHAARNDDGSGAAF
jgi:hypothetical protein